MASDSNTTAASAVTDQLVSITLTQAELAGEIGRRLHDLIYRHYLVIDLDALFVKPFRARLFTDGCHYVGVGKLIDAGNLFGALNHRRLRLTQVKISGG